MEEYCKRSNKKAPPVDAEEVEEDTTRFAYQPPVFQWLPSVGTWLYLRSFSLNLVVFLEEVLGKGESLVQQILNILCMSAHIYAPTTGGSPAAENIHRMYQRGLPPWALGRVLLGADHQGSSYPA